MQIKWKFGFIICAFSASIFANQLNVDSHQIKQEKNQFIQTMVKKNHFNRRQLTHLIYSLHPNKEILNTMARPFEKQPWTYYHNFFLTPKRISLGAKYLKDHHYVLMQMQKKYGIPANIITAIIGVETEYGTHLGKYRVLDALYTLGFYYPPREKFFRKELGEYLILTRDNHLNIKSIKGSYAGALGIPQFMPSSYRHYGVSYNKGGHINLFNQNDAIASVANYFYKMGWKPNQLIVERMHSKHQTVDDKKAMLVTLPVKHGTQYWAAHENFKVIMSYNHNIVYAMAVYQLSQAIKETYSSSR